MNKIKLISMSVLIVCIIGGCSSKYTYEGNAEYAQLTERNVIYRDLTKQLDESN